MPKVYNKRHNDAPLDAVYIGRPSRYGNPFKIGPGGTRDEVVAEFRFWFNNTLPYSLRKKALEELKGKDLVCWCAPEACHGDVLLELAND